MWFRNLRVLALGAALGLSACAPVGSGGLVVGTAPAFHSGVAPLGWSSPGWHGAGQPWRQAPSWHSRPAGGWGPPGHHRFSHHRAWQGAHHRGWDAHGWHGRGLHNRGGPGFRW